VSDRRRCPSKAASAAWGPRGILQDRSAESGSPERWAVPVPRPADHAHVPCLSCDVFVVCAPQFPPDMRKKAGACSNAFSLAMVSYGFARSTDFWPVWSAFKRVEGRRPLRPKTGKFQIPLKKNRVLTFMSSQRVPLRVGWKGGER